MSDRQTFEMSDDDFEQLLKASRPTRCMKIGNYYPPTPQEIANRAWAALGKKMGFHYMTVRPISGKSDQHFTAEARPVEEAGYE
jgi:hypothetical protein